MKIKFDNGIIEYRMPNIPEALRLMSKIKASGESFDELEIAAEMLLNIGPMITKIKLNGKVLTYEKALKNFSLMAPLTEVSTKIMECFNQDDKKKV